MTLYTAEEREALVRYYGPDYVRASETIGLRCPDMHLAMATYTPVAPPGSQRAPKAQPNRPKQRKDPNCRNQRKRRRS